MAAPDGEEVHNLWAWEQSGPLLAYTLDDVVWNAVVDSTLFFAQFVLSCAHYALVEMCPCSSCFQEAIWWAIGIALHAFA